MLIYTSNRKTIYSRPSHIQPSFIRISDYPDTKLNLVRAGAITKTPCTHAQYLQKQLHRAIERSSYGEMAESSSSTVAPSSGVQKRKRKVLSITPSWPFWSPSLKELVRLNWQSNTEL